MRRVGSATNLQRVADGGSAALGAELNGLMRADRKPINR